MNQNTEFNAKITLTSKGFVIAVEGKDKHKAVDLRNMLVGAGLNDDQACEREVATVDAGSAGVDYDMWLGFSSEGHSHTDDGEAEEETHS